MSDKKEQIRWMRASSERYMLLVILSFGVAAILGDVERMASSFVAIGVLGMVGMLLMFAGVLYYRMEIRGETDE